MHKKYCIFFFVFFSFLVLCSYQNPQIQNKLPDSPGKNILGNNPTTESTGNAMLIGKFSGSFPVDQLFNIKLIIPNLFPRVLNSLDLYNTQLKENGTFSFSIPLLTSSYALFEINEKEYGSILLSPGKTTEIELSLNERDEIQIKTIEGYSLTQEEVDETGMIFSNFIQKISDSIRFEELRLEVSPEEYKEYILKWTEEQFDAIYWNTGLSEDLKQFVHRHMKWYSYVTCLFYYGNGDYNFYEKRQSKEKTNDTIFIKAKPDKEYYSFLRFYDWNNPLIMQSLNYPSIFQCILADNVLNIPNIKKQPLTVWLKEVKAIMDPLIGTDIGSFYEMLTFHAYLKQLNEESNILSDQQKEDVKAYFKNPSFAKFLFAENGATVEKTKLPAIIKETPAIGVENLIDVIVSSYKGKVVVIDFWATWCSPCLRNIKELQGLKLDMLNKDVIFVSITNDSSPKDLWKKMLLAIGGEHYYLDEKEWNSISYLDKYELKGLPTYFIFDATGKLKYKMTGYHEKEEIKRVIGELL